MTELYKKCSFCRAESRSDSKFCSNCGKEFEIKEKVEKACIKCKNKIDIEDLYCKYCGEIQSKETFKYSIAGILLSFLIIGPFCFANLWKSTKISKEMKITLTFVLTGISVFIILGIVAMVNGIIEQLNNIMMMM